MKINEGFVSTEEYFKRMQAKYDQPKIKQKKLYEWQELGAKVIKEFEVPKEKQSWIFKICKTYPKPFVEHALNESKTIQSFIYNIYKK